MKKVLLSLVGMLLGVALLHAATTNVSPGTGKLKAAITNASSGDVLVLTAGTYEETSTLKLEAKALTIKAASGTQPILNMGSRFEVKANFTMEGIKFIGAAEAVRMVKGSSQYNVTIRNCELSGCPSYYLRAYDTDASSPYINKLTVDNCIFRMEKAADSETKARAVYLYKFHKQAIDLEVKNCTFDGGVNGTGRMIYVYPDGEPSDNPISIPGSITVDHCTFYNTLDTRGVYLANINGCQVSNCIFVNPAQLDNGVGFALYGSESLIKNCVSWLAPIKLGSGAVQENCVNRNPYFVDAANGNFQLHSNSAAVNAGSDGSTIGDPRWGVSPVAYDNSNDPYEPYKMPYSMAPTTTSVKVLWQMADETEATEALIYYGTDPNNLNMQVQTDAGWNVADEGYMHVVTLTGLQPNTRYYFTVGANATRRCAKVSWTKTAPEQGTAYRIFTISDIHGNSCNNWSNMQDFICNLNCDISLMNGDFVSSKGNDRNWNNYFFKPGEQFLGQVPIMSSPGNHETGDPFTYRWSSFYDYFHQFSHEGPSEGDLIDPRGESYFHFVYGNADVVVLNINGDPSSPEFLPGSRQYFWTDSILNECNRPWIIICHHVGVHTTGYHGQWADEPRQMGTLFEKYAAAPYNKHIISLSGDDHSFEHLYKDGVHYVRPGCGRNANYAQQTKLNDYRYSLYYNKISCFSTLDMAADASHIYLTAYDSVGTVFYNYDFQLSGTTVDPSVNFTSPTVETSTEDSIKLQWYTFDPAKDATVSLYYSRTANAASVSGMTPIATNLARGVEKYVWHTRAVTPKGKYYVYATITSGGQTYMGKNVAVINLLDDTTPPPAPSELSGYLYGGQYNLAWKNPTRKVHIDNLLADFSNGVGNMEIDSEEGASMNISVDNGALKCDYNISTAWATAAADYVFAEATDMQKTPILSFRLKGNGKSVDLRIVCKNISDGHEDWWFTEQFDLSSTSWKTVTLDMSKLGKFDWYANADEVNRLEGLKRISFGISTENAASGTFYLDDIMLSGDVNPAPDFYETVIVRKDNAFPTSHADGVEIYRGTAETCADPSATVGEIYYYAAFASDDRGNWSGPDAGAQWKSENVQEGSAVQTLNSDEHAAKMLHNGQVFVRRNARTYTVLGQQTAGK